MFAFLLQFEQRIYGAIGCAALRFEGFSSAASHGGALGFIGNQFHKNEWDLGRAYDPHCIVALKEADDVAKIFVMVPDDNGDAVPGRLDDVVSAALDKTSADKGEGPELIERREFADGVDKQNSSDDWLAAPERAPPEAHADTLKQRGDLRKAFGMTGRENHDSFGMAGEHVAERREKKSFFGFERTATDEDGSGAGCA
ncbi:MAG TPA: hypothetical protein VFD27_04170, partial [Chthoniobacteraceae bacterium]|nr:hypothetical protein [Chthoniobacteraceae bacterium]